jgi:hypothetical protein
MQYFSDEAMLIEDVVETRSAFVTVRQCAGRPAG